MTSAGSKLLLVGAMVACVGAGLAHGQSLTDSKPLRIIVITSPGGAADTAARMLADSLTKSLKRPVLVENKPGAGGNIATEYVAQWPADGSVVLLTSNNHTINPTLFHKVNYDWQKSFEPVIQITRGPSVIAAFTGLNVKSVKDLVGLSKAGAWSYGSTGLGSAGNLAFEIFKKESGARIVHIPYKGAGPAVADALGGQVQLVSVSLTSAITYIKAGRLTGLAVTSKNRWPDTPDIPTLVETGCNACVYETYMGILAPKGTQQAYIKELNEQIAKVLNDPAIKQRLGTLGMEPAIGTPEEFAAVLKSDFHAAAKVIRETGMTVE